MTSVATMMENYATELKLFFTTNCIVLAVFTLLTIAGIGGINSMINIKNENRYIVYFLYGMTMKQCARIEALRSGSLIVTSYLFLVVGFYLSPIHTWFPINKYKITGGTFLIILIYLSLIYMGTSIPFVAKLGKKEGMKNYKQRA